MNESVTGAEYFQAQSGVEYFQAQSGVQRIGYTQSNVCDAFKYETWTFPYFRALDIVKVIWEYKAVQLSSIIKPRLQLLLATSLQVSSWFSPRNAKIR